MKYFNKKVVYKGIKFDSTAERDRYIVLEAMQRKGEIANLELQKVFVTLPRLMKTVTIRKQLKTKISEKVVERVDEKETKYHADFFYEIPSKNLLVIEEVKSKATRYIRDYQIRRKLVKMMVRRLNEELGYERYVFLEIIK